MNIGLLLRRWLSGRFGLAVSLFVTLIAVAVVVRAVDRDLLRRAAEQAVSSPEQVGLAMVAFGLAFVLRAIAWQRVLPRLGFGHAISGIHVALGANHVLPLRLGEPMRIVSVVRRAGIGTDVATASTVTLRAADVLAMAAIGVVVAPVLFVELVGPFGWLLLGVVAAASVVGWRWLARMREGSGARAEVRLPGIGVFLLAAAAWMAESVVVWQAARWAGLDLAWNHALLVATVAVAAQIAAIAPGGFGTYEAAAVAAYVTAGYEADAALVAALGAHATKTLYSLVTGVVAIFVPAPGLLGRFRLDRRRSSGSDLGQNDAAVLSQPSGDEPVLFFMPAFNEEAAVGSCVERVPSTVLGRRVEVLVVDDGSIDATAARASAAGAEVHSLDRNRGLGAAVRVGLAHGVARGAAAVVFCDADGEYPPEELENLVRPILEGQADYVSGSRFLGRIDHMHPHRRIGNVVLSAWLSLVARRHVTDGQSGYRAFSPAAAAEAEIIHDFNYAQVLTLDLLAKGFRFVEVPISYRFRTEGESFIKLGRYLRNTVPAVYRELNAP